VRVAAISSSAPGSVFERFRGPDTDATRLVLLKAIAEFAAPLTETFRGIKARVATSTAAGEQRPALAPLFGLLRSCTQIYGLLTYIDLAEYFEDNLAEWMSNFHEYLM
jgi:hypothetical protein